MNKETPKELIERIGYNEFYRYYMEKQYYIKVLEEKIDKAIEYIESIDKVEIKWFDYDKFHKYHLISQEELKKKVEEENLEGHFIEVNKDKLLEILGDK